MVQLFEYFCIICPLVWYISPLTSCIEICLGNGRRVGDIPLPPPLTLLPASGVDGVCLSLIREPVCTLSPQRRVEARPVSGRGSKQQGTTRQSATQKPISFSRFREPRVSPCSKRYTALEETREGPAPTACPSSSTVELLAMIGWPR